MGVAPPHHLAKAHGHAPCNEWGTAVLSFPLALSKVCPKCQDALLHRQKTPWKSYSSAFRVLWHGSNPVFFRNAYIYCPGHLSINYQNAPGHYFQTDQLLSNQFSKEIIDYSLPAKANAKHLKRKSCNRHTQICLSGEENH